MMAPKQALPKSGWIVRDASLQDLDGMRECMLLGSDYLYAIHVNELKETMEKGDDKVGFVQKIDGRADVGRAGSAVGYAYWVMKEEKNRWGISLRCLCMLLL